MDDKDELGVTSLKNKLLINNFLMKFSLFICFSIKWTLVQTFCVCSEAWTYAVHNRTFIIYDWMDSWLYLEKNCRGLHPFNLL